MAQLSNQAVASYTELGEVINTQSNISLFSILGADMTVVKSQVPIQGIVGTECTFTIIITNTSLLNTITDLTLRDELFDAGYSLVANSLEVNGVATAGDIDFGITLPNLPPLGVHTIEFKANVM